MNDKPTEPVILAIRKLICAIIATKMEFGLSINVNSEIPIGAGLGSSGAFSVALAGALYLLKHGSLSHKDIYDLAWDAERIFHGPGASGIDHRMSTYGGFCLFNGSFDKIVGSPFRSTYIINTKIAKKSTRELIDCVAQFRDDDLIAFDALIDRVNKWILTICGTTFNLNSAALWKSYIKDNQALLEQIGVSTREISCICRDLWEDYQMAAKLTGAGGGGCIVVFVDGEGDYTERIGQVAQRYLPKAEVREIKLSTPGILVEHD